MPEPADASPPHLTLLVPGLFKGSGRARALETLLCRADLDNTATAGREAGLFALFGVASSSTSDIPVAALSQLALQGEEEGMWLCADPVHLVADQSQVYLSDPGRLPVSEAEAAALIKELNEFYAEDGWCFTLASPHSWYLRVPSARPICTTSLADATEQPIASLLPRGEEEREWRRVMNELQMILHNSPVNREREAEGKPPINGLWLWGAGSLPEAASAVPWHKVWSGDAFVKGLARLHRLPAYGLPGSYAAWRKRAGGTAQSVSGGASELFVFDVLSDPRIEPSLYAEWLERLEGMWFAPLLAALQRGEVGSISLSGMDGRVWRITPKSARRWWRRRRPLAAYSTSPSAA